MSSKDDRRAAGILLSLALAGALVRIVTGDTAAPGAVAYRVAPLDRPSRDTVAARARRLSQPLRAGETIDIDRASVEELARLPRIGAGLAGRIVADRESRGPFGSLEELGRVPGLGDRTLELLEAQVRFSGRPRAEAANRPGGRLRLNRATAKELEGLPGVGPKLAAAIVADRARRGPYRTLDDLMRVRGIGPATVDRLRGRILVP